MAGTTVTACRFDATNIAAGTVAIGAMGLNANSKVIFGVVGNDMVVFGFNY
jgi:hypothetical protein